MNKASYQELEKRIRELESESLERKRIEAELLEKQSILRKQNINLVRKSIELSDIMRELEDKNYDLELSRSDLEKAEEKYRTLTENSLTGIFIHQDGKYVFVNNRFAKIHGYTPEELLGREHWLLVRSDEREIARQKALKRLNGEAVPQSYEIRRLKKDGKTIWCRMMATPIEYRDRPAIMGNIMDITEIKHAKEEKKKLEAQLRQAQKMEAIGTLAGGVAHDFNNLLTVIIGNADLALMNVIKDESLRKEIGEIKKAGDRAASLIMQLLAFSRKQVIQPEVLDLNEMINEMEKMLGRLIAEDVELLTIPEPALWQVEVDPGQMEQVIMNLAINARDAMPRGGKLTIETANMDLDENYFREHGIEETAGPYVMLAVSDTGCGMDKETQEHIFEPFFTTKGVGKGTGLGLSTVYGIVKQNNGFAWVYSEPGQGSTFKVYLPKAEGDADSEEKQRLPVMELDGSETVLIVEDDEGLRKFAQEVLRQHGYKVLDAENGEDALRVSEAHEGPIHLMITDVVMPKMGGKEAADRLQPFYPQMKVIYMSGYADNAIVHHGVLAPGLNFLQKPFTPEGLARKVREALGSEK